ncbi:MULTISPECIES: hypothetical protein [Novosphingobium]|uniref:hypothetical protein n=1 Tax=Novosphingobium TaxID=165696 RepID=UPI000D473BB2|nr:MULTISPECIES: hypothetical protein [Novosphingobium]PTR07865.1 hypothetical protein C8K11_11376 [Novosphingobium sp. GV055]PUB00678.1 hypothetical protein C8K12_11376 [Novosphingobium sp. GV061]PUB16087.1 hypothetical protein C8K14_11376 [Novosphingobium sp. GV079]PUB39552.1 hypothetical protein C8K10_11376 [Novosphingobium sp. GV027]WQD93778.1 hypothetical protein U0041_04045 [Novosphingobium capsulatum]
MGSSMGPIGMGVQALGSFAQGYAGYRAGMFNARVAQANAQGALVDGATASAASDAKYRAAIGEQLAAQGAGGFQMGTGSNLDAVLASRVNQTYAAMSIQRQAAARAVGFNNQAEMSRYSARQALFQGISNAASGMMKNTTDYALSGQQYGYDSSGQSGALTPSTWNPMNEVQYG